MTDIERLYNTWQSLQPLTAEDQLRLDRKFMLEFNYNSNHLEEILSHTDKQNCCFYLARSLMRQT